ncbi:hypothetical protein FKN04_24445 [Bacillus glycinifermentans]|uniref:hypothetical protein n=1 Tax=Bacillus glycinifermentans TaxID=1664069 RepID=UPI00158186CC|nr:hypothetical protein [Bacillus glycinifermentans]NUJ19680.1 hypothetical protein [Bacillus glycinifermentans]
MKQTMKVALALVMSLVLLIPTTSTFAAEQNNEQSNDVSNTNVSTTLPTTFTPCSNEDADSGQLISIKKIPGDYNNSCKIVKTEKRDNVRWTNWENQLIPFILSGGLGVIGNYIAPGPLKAFIWSGITGIYASYPKSKPLYVTIQHRECKDMKGYHQYLIIKYYKDKKRTKFITSEMKKLS